MKDSITAVFALAMLLTAAWFMDRPSGQDAVCRTRLAAPIPNGVTR